MTAQTRVRLTHCLYVIELDPEVLKRAAYLEANPGYVFDPGRPPLYVGMTGRTPEIRFGQHKAGYKSNRFARRFGIRLRQELVPFGSRLTYADAQDLEVALARILRESGFAVWQN